MIVEDFLSNTKCLYFFQLLNSEGSDEEMEEVDGTIYPLPQPTTISSEADWEGLDDILRISPDPLELDDDEGGAGGNGERCNNLANQGTGKQDVVPINSFYYVFV